MSEMDGYDAGQYGEEPISGLIDDVQGALSSAADIATHILDDAPYIVHGLNDGHAGVVDGAHMGQETAEHKAAYVGGWVEGNRQEHDEHPKIDLSPRPEHQGQTMNPISADDERRSIEAQKAHDTMKHWFDGDFEPEPHIEPGDYKPSDIPEAPVVD
jgi:hypothetical protein